MGRVVLSIDAELAWGFHDLEHPPKTRIERARWGWRRLLELLEAYELPATWCVVGQLFFRDTWLSHPRLEGGSTKTGKSVEHWVGPDLIAAIRDADVDHELGSHSFSHTLFDPEADRATLEAELEACVAIAADQDISLESFVFPRNVVGHRELLAEYGFRCYRGEKPPRWYEGSRLYPAGKFASFVAGRRPPPVVTPTVDEHGLVDIPASLCLFSFEGIARSLVEPIAGDPVVRKARQGIDAAEATGDICHLWLHPNDLTARRDRRRLQAIFTYIDERRRLGDLEVEPMATVAAEVAETAPTAQIDESPLEPESAVPAGTAVDN